MQSTKDSPKRITFIIEYNKGNQVEWISLRGLLIILFNKKIIPMSCHPGINFFPNKRSSHLFFFPNKRLEDGNTCMLTTYPLLVYGIIVNYSACACDF